MDYKVTEIFKDTYQIKEYDDRGHVYMYLLLGEKSAMLVDCGFGTFDLHSVIKELTDLPVDLILTHGHFDHIGGAKYFDSIFIHREDEAIFKNVFEKHVKHIDKDTVFELGNRRLSVFLVPGHTGGSLCVYDESNNLLFTGDTACEGDILLLFPESKEPNVYLESMLSLKDFINEKGIEITWPSHHRCPLNSEIINDFIELAQKLIKNEIELKDEETQFGPAKHGIFKNIGVLI